MHRRIQHYLHRCIVLLHGVPTGRRGRRSRPPGGPSEAAPALDGCGVSKPPFAAPTDDFAPTSQLSPFHFDLASSAIRPGEAALLDRNAAC